MQSAVGHSVSAERPGRAVEHHSGRDQIRQGGTSEHRVEPTLPLPQLRARLHRDVAHGAVPTGPNMPQYDCSLLQIARATFVKFVPAL